jgi:hypothetical protein
MAAGPTARGVEAARGVVQRNLHERVEPQRPPSPDPIEEVAGHSVGEVCTARAANGANASDIRERAALHLPRESVKEPRSP